jgi:hypothetical protein
MKTGEACEGIALKYAEECAVFDAVTDVRTVAVVNVSREPRRVRIECPGWKRFRQATRYRYGEGLMRTEGDHTLLPDATGLRIDFRSGAEYDMPGESMILLTEQND